MNALLGQSEDVGILALDKALGSRMTPQLLAARDGLHEAARKLSHEVAINRELLREEMERAAKAASVTGRLSAPRGRDAT